MKLFQVLFRRKGMPNGNIYRGKRRIIKPIKPEELSQLKREFEIEERNMFLLRHSFLTPEQSKGHAKALGLDQQKLVKLLTKKKEFYDNVTIESRLGHLRYKEAWE